ncbi:MAG: DUF4231 domain-containing protein [Pyrinomonadaceae bacterium]
MSAVVIAQDPVKELENHLAAQLKFSERRGSFDMDDGPEAKALAPFPELKAALDWLDSKLGEKWRLADQEALNCQSYHRRLARIAIATGTAAIVLAIVQLSIKLTAPSLTVVGLILEASAIAAAVIAVAVGLRTKFDRRWLAQRHLAERLRMLKFRALEQLWCSEQSKWYQWVKEQITSLQGIEDAKEIRGKIGEWSTGGLIEPDLATSLACEPDLSLVRALTIYYRFKRVEFQADYFDRRRKDFKKETGRWLHLNLPLFLTSVGCVIAHFALEYFATRAGSEPLASLLEDLAVWFVALAAIIPVLGLGMRAWFAAFELPRSASLFAAKYQALKHLTNQLEQDSAKVLPTLHHLAQTEHFLEHEHREWLRLLAETEWFL